MFTLEQCSNCKKFMTTNEINYSEKYYKEKLCYSCQREVTANKIDGKNVA